MRITSCLLLLLALLGASAARAQSRHWYWDADYDSLRQTLARPQADTARLRTLRHLIDITELTDARRRETTLPLLDELLLIGGRVPGFDARPYRPLREGVQQWMAGTEASATLRSLHQAVELFDQQHHPIPRLLADLAPLYNTLHAEKARVSYYETKLRQYQRANIRQNMAACYIVLGGSYRHRGDLNLAIGYYLRAADIFGETELSNHIIGLMISGSTYAEWGNTTKALYYLNRALTLEERHHFHGLRRYFTLQSLARVYLQQGRYRQALHSADQALQVARQDSVIQGMATAYGLLLKSTVLVEQDPGRALPLLQRTQQLADSLDLHISGRLGDFPLDMTWARYYLRQHDYARAEQRLLMAYHKLRVGHLNLQQPKVLRQLIDFYAARQQPAQAQRFAQEYFALTDSLATEQSPLHVAHYEAERLEKIRQAQVAGLREQQAVQALRLRQQTWLLILALVIVAVVSGLGVGLYRQLRQNQRTLAQLRQTQNQLVAAEKWAFVGEVSAGIAHELQNPLNFMKRFAEVSSRLLDNMQQPAATSLNSGPDDHLQQEIVVGLRQNLREISQHGLRASAIIRDMLEHSRSGQNRRQLTDLNALITEQARLAYEGVRNQTPDFTATVLLDLVPDLLPLDVVPQDLGRALLNLLTNALHAVRQRASIAGPDYEPTVRVSTRRSGHQVEIRVHDNGTGMSPAVQARIFQPFFTTKPVGEGTGLGLSLTHDIVVKGHGGTLRAETREGEYTEFVVALPAA